MIGGYPSVVFNRDRRSYGIPRPPIWTDFADLARMPVDQRLNAFVLDPNVIDRAKK